MEAGSSSRRLTGANFIRKSRGYLTTSPRGFFFSYVALEDVTCIASREADQVIENDQ
jgi:hypothetical protein